MRLIALLALAFVAAGQYSEFGVVFGDNWHYLDTGSDPNKAPQNGITWTQYFYSTTTWKSGYAPLAVGANNQVTTLLSGPQNTHYISYYFRKVSAHVLHDQRLYSRSTLCTLDGCRPVHTKLALSHRADVQYVTIICCYIECDHQFHRYGRCGHLPQRGVDRVSEPARPAPRHLLPGPLVPSILCANKCYYVHAAGGRAAARRQRHRRRGAQV